MSAKSLSLKSPGLIVAVVVMGAVVTVLNIRTFGGKHQTMRTESARTQAYPVLPGDLGELVRLAGREMRNQSDGSDGAVDPYETPGRDPFLDPSEKAPVASPKSATAAAPRAAAPVKLTCAAVLLGGDQPLAVLGGRTRRVGEKVGAWTVAAIGASGVVLKDDAGRERLLKGAPHTAAATFSVTVGGQSAPLKDVSERMEP